MSMRTIIFDSPPQKRRSFVITILKPSSGSSPKYPDLINARTCRGETPFDWAFDVRRFDIARLLLLRGVEAGFAETYDWYSEIIKRETSIEKVELLLEAREQLMCYDGVYHPPQLQERCPLMGYIWFPSY